jgi:hypothetical protein
MWAFEHAVNTFTSPLLVSNVIIYNVETLLSGVDGAGRRSGALVGWLEDCHWLEFNQGRFGRTEVI